MSSTGSVPPSTTGTCSSPRARIKFTIIAAYCRCCSAERREPDHVHVLLDRGFDDRLGGLMDAEVNHLHPRGLQEPRDDFHSAVVSVEADLGEKDFGFWCHQVHSLGVSSTPIGS